MTLAYGNGSGGQYIEGEANVRAQFPNLEWDRLACLVAGKVDLRYRFRATLRSAPTSPLGATGWLGSGRSATDLVTDINHVDIEVIIPHISPILPDLTADAPYLKQIPLVKERSVVKHCRDAVTDLLLDSGVPINRHALDQLFAGEESRKIGYECHLDARALLRLDTTEIQTLRRVLSVLADHQL
jgi:hypothetical protein